MTTPILAITDGVTRISLHSDNGLYLRNWQPGRAADKKVRREPVFAGGQVVINDYGNVIDTLEVGLRGHCQDNIIAMLQDLDRLLQKAVNYWASTWTWEPVWLEARGPEETETRYAVIRDYAIDGMTNPYAQPFFTSFGMGAMNQLTMAIEHDIWQADEPGTATCVKMYHTESTASPVEEPAIVSAGDEDAYTDSGAGGSIDVVGNNLLMGADAAGDTLNTGLIFHDVDIPNGSIILAAYVMLYANANTAGATCNLRIYGDTTPTPAGFTTYADFVGRPRTTAYVDWSAVPAWTNTNFYYTPNIRTVIQEIVSGGGWSDSNEDLGIFIQNNSSSASAYRQAGSLENGGPVPYLLVIYKSGTLVQGIIAADATCSDYNYVTNYHAGLYNTLAEGITHAYAYDASLGTYSANIMTAALPVALYPAVPANNDCLYIGAVDTAIGALDDKNVFTNVVFDIGTAATYAAGTSSTWQYWNGAAWAGLTFHDETSTGTANTSAFSVTGVHSLHFNLPSNWAATVINGVPAYWIRCLLTSGGGAIGVPTQANRDIYACRWGCVDIDDEQVLGDIPALAKLMVHTRSDDSFVDRLPAEHCQVIMGLRTEERGTWALDRGSIFQAYLPCASDMRCRGQSHNYYSVGGSFATAEAADYRSPYGGLSCQYTSVTTHTMQRIYMATLDYPTAGDFLGTYHMFVRYCQTTGSDGDLRMGYRVGASASTTIAKSVILRQSSNIEVADFGRVTIGSEVFGRDAEESIFLYIHLFMECTVAAVVNCYIYDIVLIPADEWYAKITVDGETGDVVDDDLYLDVDSATTPKNRRKAVVRDIEAIDGYYKIRYPWTWQGAGPAILQPNRTQRVWFLSFQATTLGPPPTGDLVAPFPLSASVRAEATARYLSMRGAR